jgi:hypothetical protein
VPGIADHIRKFWDPRMRSAIMAHLDAGGAGLDLKVRDALATLRSGGVVRLVIERLALRAGETSPARGTNLSSRRPACATSRVGLWLRRVNISKRRCASGEARPRRDPKVIFPPYWINTIHRRGD